MAEHPPDPFPVGRRSDIRVITLAIAWRGDELLLCEGRDDVKGDSFFRPPGGGIEFGETAAVALAREMMEEFGQPIRPGRQVGIIENIFTYNGEAGHQIAFLYEVEFEDRAFYRRDEIPIRGEDGWAGPATWRRLAMFGRSGARLVPEGLYDVLSAERPGR